MFHLQYLLQLFEWHACEIAGLSRMAKRIDHYNHQFTLTVLHKNSKKKKKATTCVFSLKFRELLSRSLLVRTFEKDGTPVIKRVGKK